VRRGLSLVELLVSLVIALLLLSAIYLGYVSLFKTSSQETISATSQIEKLLGLEILRLDVEHAGYGIAYKLSNGSEGDFPIEWNGTTLTIRSIYNVSNEETNSWGIYDCSNRNFIVKEGNFKNSTTVVALEPISDYTVFFNSGRLSSICNGTEKKYLVFSYDSSSSGSCKQPVCNEIKYYLYSSSSVPNYCVTNTVLGRKVNAGNPNPLIYCVADFKVRFDWDTNGNGIIDSGEENQNINIPPSSSTKVYSVRKQLKLVIIYLLVQEGKYDPRYNFSANTTIDGVILNLPSNPKARHCRWKIVKMVVKPMNL